ncbi:CCAAT/enhancer-binding protein zeta [Pristis pectinata]|uniref:CCAAT/enhancer-binding protein zeta n=1 Tax=Pristis pectinata TaxID=685728 RepID=UPI00223E4FDD|nr:CCAAT/enhancer-binding protein zeta [Pristis pectinata]
MAAAEEELEVGEDLDADEVDPECEDDGEESANTEFTLDEVLRLGGTKADYLMLFHLNENEELVDGGKKSAIDDLEKGELEAFIKKIGVRKYSKIVLEENKECTKGEKQAKKEGEKIDKKGKKNKNKELKEKIQDGKADKKGQPGKIGKQNLIQDNEVSSTSEIPGRKTKRQDIFEFHPKQYLLVKPGGKWYDADCANEHTSEPQDESFVAQYKNLAKQLYEHETNLYTNKKNIQKGANSTWMKTVVTTGTLADRMAAMTLLIQDAPVHTLHFVEVLVNQIKKKGSRRQSLMALSTLTELLISDLLPDNRKLQTFSQHPFKKLEELASGNKDARDKRLIMWYFEHLLKHHFAEFVQALETLTHDNVQATKAHALGTVHEILCNKPEQEKALLIQLVNKLGDPQYKMATKASYLLETLLHKHPNMKTVVCCEVERLLYRPNISLKAQYYAICFLNQMVLSHEESDLAGKLIAVYFSFFHAFVKKAEIDSKMLSALLSGVNRAFPYSKTDDGKIMEQMDTLFKVVHVVNFTTSVQALMLLFQVMDSKQAISNRYYVTLYRKLLDPGLAQSSKQAMFLNLLYKSLKSDVVLRRIKAFIKRILQATCGQTPSFICGALYLISEILKLKPGLQALLQEHWESDEEEHFRDVDDSDEDKSENLDKENMVNKSHEGKKYGDADKERVVQNTVAAVKPKSTASGSWLHLKNQEGGKSLGTYDPLHRNPLSCGADHAGLWELKKLSEHFHPSVALFATTILQGNQIQYTGDPLQDFTLMRFLDRFVYRNPKQQKGKGNTDSIVMQPKQRSLLNNPLKLPVNSQKFIEQEESQVPVDEIFFHRYYKRLDASQKSRRLRRGEEAVEDVDDDEFEQVLDSLEGEKYFKTIEDSLDFASNMKPKSSKGIDEQVDSDLDDDDDMSNLDDEEVSLGSLDEEDFGEVVEEDGGVFMNDTDDEEVDSAAAVKKSNKPGKRKKSEDLDFSKHVKGKKRKRGFKDDADMFAAAEEFGCLLDENAGSKFDNVGINAMANKDKASIKQLQWESDRDAWIRGKDPHTLRRQKNFRAKRLKNKQRRFLNKR